MRHNRARHPPSKVRVAALVRLPLSFYGLTDYLPTPRLIAELERPILTALIKHYLGIDIGEDKRLPLPIVYHKLYFGPERKVYGGSSRFRVEYRLLTERMGDRPKRLRIWTGRIGVENGKRVLILKAKLSAAKRQKHSNIAAAR